MADVVLITGISGAGLSAGAAVLEDLDYYVVDNLPASLVPTIVELASQPGGGIERLALVSGRNPPDLIREVAKLRADGHRVRVLFLDADTPTLVQRYDATRRKHPRADETGGVLEAIEYERGLFDPLKQQADLVIDTSDLNVHQLKQRLVGAFAPSDDQRMNVTVESFGFKHGLPLDADVVMDVRFLPNPHWEDALRPLTGLDSDVRDYVLDRPVTQQFLGQFEQMIADLLPAYQAEGRSYLTIAIGCTGGRHRSVACAEEIARRLNGRGVAATTSHRDTHV
ncbi:MAG TPA: RNase adapter RapZ [Ilumatobacter sp.]|nr:RNase adapter RapZ [Ilumatobacter sp.]